MTFGCCFIDGVHFGLEFAALVVGEGWGGFFLPRELDPLCYDGHWVFASHTVVGIVRDESCLLPSCMVAGLVALEDELGFAIVNFIEELMPRYSYFAYE